VIREKEEGKVFSVQILISDRSVFKLAIGGSNVLVLAPNLMILFLTLSTLIRLHSLDFGSAKVQI
jgi:hypothetical protein